jgi:peroxiredoxin
VEAYLEQVAKTQDSQAWLRQARAAAQISVFTPLSIAAPTPTAPNTAAKPGDESLPTPATPTSATPDLPTGSLAGQIAPDFELPLAGGGRVRLSDLRGRPVVVTFWATWCPVCQKEMPALQASYQRYQAQGLAVLGVNVREGEAEVTAYASSVGLAFPLLLDADGQTADLYQVNGIPTTLFIDAQGVVRERRVGPVSEADFDALVEPLLAAETRTAAPCEKPLAAGFSLPDANGKTVSLDDYLGSPETGTSLVLVFYRGQT